MSRYSRGARWSLRGTAFCRMTLHCGVLMFCTTIAGAQEATLPVLHARVWTGECVAPMGGGAGGDRRSRAARDWVPPTAWRQQRPGPLSRYVPERPRHPWRLACTSDSRETALPIRHTGASPPGSAPAHNTVWAFAGYGR